MFDWSFSLGAESFGFWAMCFRLSDLEWTVCCLFYNLVSVWVLFWSILFFKIAVFWLIFAKVSNISFLMFVSGKLLKWPCLLFVWILLDFSVDSQPASENFIDFIWNKEDSFLVDALLFLDGKWSYCNLLSSKTFPFSTDLYSSAPFSEFFLIEFSHETFWRSNLRKHALLLFSFLTSLSSVSLGVILLFL